MIKNLINCYKGKKTTSVYCDSSDRQKHYTGYIAEMNDREILIAHISNNGHYDGYVVRRVEDIYRIDYDGEYEKRIELLYKGRGQSHSIVFTTEGHESLFFATLNVAQQDKLVTSLILDDDCRCGFIKGYDNDVVCLYALSDNGEEDGISVVRMAEISAIEIDTDYEQNLKLLWGMGQRGQGDGFVAPYV